MAPGRPKEVAGKLTNINSKITEENKALIDALVSVGPYKSKRELFDYWLKLHKKDNPEEFTKAEKFLDLLGGGK